MSILIKFGLLSIVIAVGIFGSFQNSLYLTSYATICFDCPGANFHLDQAKKSIDSGDYEGAKNHIDQAKQLIGQSNSTR